MRIIPSVDIIDGKAVRLYKGNFSEKTIYPASPLDMVKRYMDDGYTFVHIVNLDRASNQPNVTTERMIEQICAIPHVHIQMGGGMRNSHAIKEANDLGVSRFVIGTMAVNDKHATQSLVEAYGKHRFTFALDVIREQETYLVKTHGWKEKSTQTLFDLLEEYRTQMDYLLCTDIDKDGALSAPNFELYKEIKQRYPSIFVQASGGIHHEDDIAHLHRDNIDGVVIGKAIYENKVDLKKLFSYHAM